MHCPEHKPEKEFLTKISSSLSKGVPFCCYRKPSSEEVTAIYQASDILNFTETFDESGFVFAPFQTEDGIAIIKADSIEITSINLSSTSVENEMQIPSTGMVKHLTLVQKGIDEIQNGKLKKVVLSRYIRVKKPKDTLDTFKNLLGTYPNAFCYLFHHPKVGTWCGATPETLARISGNLLDTMSLAATLPYESGREPKWGQKEVEEQHMVSDYIQKKLEPFAETVKLEKTKSIRAGNLWHLKTAITANLRTDTSIAKLLEVLHPTPAVCGLPVAQAKRFILENEQYHREYYTGFLGEMNLNAQKEISLFVNLRCMKLTADSATIFVGGGITGSSNPNDEWEETQNKSTTMLRVL